MLHVGHTGKRICGMGAGTLPETLSEAPLVRIDVSDNQLTGTLPAAWEFQWLEEVNLGSNQIQVSFTPSLMSLHSTSDMASTTARSKLRISYATRQVLLRHMFSLAACAGAAQQIDCLGAKAAAAAGSAQPVY